MLSGVFRHFQSNLCNRTIPASYLGIQQKRYERIYKRLHPPPVPEEGEEGWRLYDKDPTDRVPALTSSHNTWVHLWDQDYQYKTNKGDEFVYSIVEEPAKPQPLDVILCWDIEKLGQTGDKIQVERSLARELLLPFGAAVYDTPENRKKYELQAQELARKRASGELETVPEMYNKVISLLEAIHLPIPMNPAINWQLNTTHVKVAFRLQGLCLTEDMISLPEEAVTNESSPDITIDVTLRTASGKVYKTVPVRASIVDKASQEARQIPFAQTFEYHEKSLTEIVLEKFVQLKAHRFRAQTTV